MANIAAGAEGAAIVVSSLFKIKQSIEANTGIRLGPQHNTHITNKTDSTIQVILKHSNGGVEIRDLERDGSSRSQICIPTPHGKITVYAIRDEPETRGRIADCQINDKSDRSFFVEKSTKGYLMLERAKYGTTTEREGLRR